MNKPGDFILLIQKSRIRRMGFIILCSVLLGVLYPTINREFGNPLAFLNGFTIGLLGGLAIAINEDHRYYSSIKREQFMVRLIKNVIIYTCYFAFIVALVVAATYGFSSGEGFINYISGPQFQQFILHGDYFIIVLYALFFCGLVSFTLIMSRLRTYFIAKNELNKQQEVYLLRWGIKPSFKAVVHVGTVVAGEIGDIKTQFVFHGEVLHQLSLMEKHCRSIGVNLLLSGEFTEVTTLPAFYKLQKCKESINNDNSDPIILYTVEQSLQEPSLPVNT